MYNFFYFERTEMLYLTFSFAYVLLFHIAEFSDRFIPLYIIIHSASNKSIWFVKEKIKQCTYLNVANVSVFSDKIKSDCAETFYVSCL